MIMLMSQSITTSEQALKLLDQLSTFVITKKGPMIRDREKFSDDILKTVSLYKNKVNKADLPSQYADIVEAAKNEFKAVFDNHLQ